MWLIAWRDLQFRRRRFVISVVAVAFVLAITLLLAGLTNFFTVEIDRTVTRLGADAWVVSDRATGPFLGSAPVPQSTVDEVATYPGVERASGVVLRSFTADDPSDTRVNLIGVEPGGIGAPAPGTGRGVEASGETVVDARLGRAVGDTVVIGATTFVVVGVLHGSTALAGAPNTFVTLDDAQAIGYASQPIVSAVAVQGDPGAIGPGPGLVVMTNDDAKTDLGGPMGNAASTIGFLSVLLWIIAACIIGSIIYLSALERLRDFAVFKAIGLSSRWVLGSLVAQAVVLTLIATALAVLLVIPLRPRFPLPSEIPASALIWLPVTAVVVAALASLAGVRRALAVDPALAFD
jgi:putative ABC transport system permease protein